MVHNFESWRKATMQRFETNASKHFHRVEDGTFAIVRSFLIAIVNCRVTQKTNHLSFSVSDEFIDYLLSFLEEMESSYMHPRSDSAKFRFASLMRSQQYCHPSLYENLSNGRK